MAIVRKMRAFNVDEIDIWAPKKDAQTFKWMGLGILLNRSKLLSISSTFYEQLFQSQAVIREKLRKALSCKKSYT